MERSPGRVHPADGGSRRASPEPADLRLRHQRGYQRLRRGVLALSILITVLGPLAQLERLHGADSEGRFITLARWLHLSIDPGLLLGAPWTIRVLGLEILDPVAAISLLFAAGPTTKIVLGALPALVLVAFFGRFFCGWLCPYIVLISAGNALRALLARLGFRAPDRSFSKNTAFFVLGGCLLLATITGSQLVPLFYPPAVVARELPRALYFGVPTLGLGALGLALSFDVLVSRAGFCRYLCPGGAVFRLIGWRSKVRVVREESKCTDCTACDVVCNLLQSPMTDRTDSGCERCAKCVAVCPTRALTISLGHPRLPVLSAKEEGSAER